MNKEIIKGIIQIACLIGLIIAPAIPSVGEKAAGFCAGVLFSVSIQSLLKE